MKENKVKKRKKREILPIYKYIDITKYIVTFYMSYILLLQTLLNDK